MMMMMMMMTMMVIIIIIIIIIITANIIVIIMIIAVISLYCYRPYPLDDLESAAAAAFGHREFTKGGLVKGGGLVIYVLLLYGYCSTPLH